MTIFMAVLSALCFGAMLSEKDQHNKMLFGACFICTIIAILMMVLLPLKVM